MKQSKRHQSLGSTFFIYVSLVPVLFAAFLAYIRLRLSGSVEVGLTDYDVVWRSQSSNSAESMPLGGGGLGINVWVENGDVLFYMQRSGSFDENNAFAKLGRMRLKLDPNPFNEYFSQTLSLHEGMVSIRGANNANLNFWVDISLAAAHVELTSAIPVLFEASYETWRYEDHELKPVEDQQSSLHGVPLPSRVTLKDHVEFDKNGILFYHQNAKNTAFDVAINQQKLSSEGDKMFNPLDNLTFGGWIHSNQLSTDRISYGEYVNTTFQDWKLTSVKPVTAVSLVIMTHVNQTSNWQKELKSIIQRGYHNDNTETVEWWQSFWGKSYIYIHDRKNSVAWQVGRNYQLFRFLLGCNKNTQWPTKSNGGLFTFDPYHVNSTRPFTPDFRKWGGGSIENQKQLSVYSPMLRSGDIDLMHSQFNFYSNVLPSAKRMTSKLFNVSGAMFHEHIENFGISNPTQWCSNQYFQNASRPADWSPGLSWNDNHIHLWDGVLGVCLLILESSQIGLDIEGYIPLIEESLLFFHSYYTKQQTIRSTPYQGSEGRLVLYPTSVGQTYKIAYNSITTISSLQTVLRRFIPIAEQRGRNHTFYKLFLSELPCIPSKKSQITQILAPAEVFERKGPEQFPELQVIFPYNQYCHSRENFEMAKSTYRHLIRQTKERPEMEGVICARLGLTDCAWNDTIMRLRDSDRRFPAFWGNSKNWVPDHSWGGAGMIGLQEMLVQTCGRSIHLLPAWPNDVDATFKLWAPFNTSLQGSVKKGKLTELKVTPAEREADVIIHEVPVS